MGSAAQSWHPGHSSEPLLGHSLLVGPFHLKYNMDLFLEESQVHFPDFRNLAARGIKQKPFQGMIVALKKKSRTSWCFEKLEHMHLIVMKVDLTFYFLKLSRFGRKKMNKYLSMQDTNVKNVWITHF